MAKRIQRLGRKFMKIFDLRKKEDADEYYALLNYLHKRKIELPIAKKGALRLIDISLKNLRRIDKELFAAFSSVEQA